MYRNAKEPCKRDDILQKRPIILIIFYYMYTNIYCVLIVSFCYYIFIENVLLLLGRTLIDS